MTARIFNEKLFQDVFKQRILLLAGWRVVIDEKHGADGSLSRYIDQRNVHAAT